MEGAGQARPAAGGGPPEAAPRRLAASFAQRLETAVHGSVEWASCGSRRAAAVLVLLCLLLYTPGIFSRPPVDRTEVYYALSARHMAETGDLLVPRDPTGVVAGRPIGILWLQALAARAFGPAAGDAIWAYRLPSLAGAILAVLALFFGLRAVIGAGAALGAAALLAGALQLAIHAHLALPQAMTLAAAIVAQTSLARIYVGAHAPLPSAGRWTALALWTALGAAVLLNSWIVPLLALLTILGLWAQDRRLGWLARTRPVTGVPLMLAIAAPWVVSVVLAAGAEGEGRPPLEWLALLVDAQSMKYRAFPGSYLLTVWLALWPSLLVLLAAARQVWRKRQLPEMRFLLAWLVPYIAIMEIVSHKPPLYMVSYVLPVLAIASALRLLDNPVTGPPAPVTVGRIPIALWFALGIGLAGTGVGLQAWFGEPRGLVLAAAVAAGAAFAAAAFAMRQTCALAAMALSLAGGAAVFWLAFAFLLPAASPLWPAVHLAAVKSALEPCYPGPALVAGYTEPSVRFLLGSATVHASGLAVPRHLEAHPRALAFVEQSEGARLASGLAAGPAPALVEIACISSHNPLTNRRGNFRVYARSPLAAEAACRLPTRYRCRGRPQP
jgi:4-amino-4-deoxy-L-arabinose transferase-like glycosyltransferase